MQTLHGQFTFFNQKFSSPEQGSWSFLHACEDFQSGVSEGLEELAVHSCLLTSSYEKACQVVKRVTGQPLMTRQTLCNLVQKTAKRLDLLLKKEVETGLQAGLPEFSRSVDLYDPTSVEVNIFEDGILVKAQNPTHWRSGEVRKEKATKFHNAYFGLAPVPSGKYAFVMGTSDRKLPLDLALRAFIGTHWQETGSALCLVAITDGEKGLRADMEAAFGSGVVLFLDWFHLRKKVCELASMVVSTKESRTQLKQSLLKSLFHGRVEEALALLASLPIRNVEMHTKLINYLTNRRSEIIDYERRARSHHPIGSGRMEKGVDQVIGLRQKDKGMSWSQSGSYALGMVTAYHANGNWSQLWNTPYGEA